jgi:hypothetical protein
VRLAGAAPRKEDLMSEPEDATIDAMARELETYGTLELVLQPISALQLAGVVQLALRHPDLAGAPREAAIRFVAGVRAYFQTAPTVQAVIDRGDQENVMNFEEFVRRGQAADRAVTLALYQTMTTRELRQLHAAFIADKYSAGQSAHAAHSIAFCDGRLAIIDEVLRDREA